MIEGIFYKNTPFVTIALKTKKGFEKDIVAVLDTAFSDDVQITPHIAEKIRLLHMEPVLVRIADGSRHKIPSAMAQASMESKQAAVRIFISDSLPLIGISFLSKFSYIATFDCKNKTVALEAA